MTEVIELRPNKDLINSSFEKYQFSTDALPITSEIKLKNRKSNLHFIWELHIFYIDNF